MAMVNLTRMTMTKLGINFENVLAITKELDLNVLQTLNKLKSIGISSLDVKYERLTGEKSYLKDILISNMNIGSIFSFCPLHEQNNTQKALSMVDFCAEHNVKEIMIITDFVSGGYSSDQLFNLKQNLRRIVKYAEIYGVSIGIENVGNPDYPLKNALGSLDVLKSVKGLHLIFDGGNFIMASQNALEASKVLAPYVQRYHLKDYIFDGAEFKAVPIGEGLSDCKEAYDVISECYSKVPLVLEFPFKDENIYSAVEKSALYVLTEILQ